MKSTGKIVFSESENDKEEQSKYGSVSHNITTVNTVSSPKLQKIKADNDKTSKNPKVQNYLKDIFSVDATKEDPHQQIIDSNDRDNSNINNTLPTIKGLKETKKKNDKQDSGNRDIQTKKNKDNTGKDKNVADNNSEADKLDSLVQQSDTVLFRLKTINPVDPFPDEIAVDLAKVEFIFKDFIGSETHHSSMIKDINDVMVSTTPFFSKLIIVDNSFTENTINVEYLNTEDAIKARNIIQGIRIAREHNIEIEKIPPDQLVDKLINLGENTME